jgi:hypothetical protein
MILSMSGFAKGTSAMLAAFRFELGQAQAPISAGHRIGPGRRTLDALRKKIEDERVRNTDGAQRMRDVIDARRANWLK